MVKKLSLREFTMLITCELLDTIVHDFDDINEIRIATRIALKVKNLVLARINEKFVDLNNAYSTQFFDSMLLELTGTLLVSIYDSALSIRSKSIVHNFINDKRSEYSN